MIPPVDDSDSSDDEEDGGKAQRRRVRRSGVSSQPLAGQPSTPLSGGLSVCRACGKTCVCNAHEA